MNVNFSEEELAFEREVKAFFKDKYPDDIRQKQDNGVTLSKEDMIRWQKILFIKAGQPSIGPSNTAALAGPPFRNTYSPMS